MAVDLGQLRTSECLGILSVAAWTAVTISIAILSDQGNSLVFVYTPEEELRGLGCYRAWHAIFLCRLYASRRYVLL